VVRTLHESPIWSLNQVIGKNKSLNEMIRIISPKFGLRVSQQVRIGLLAALISWSVCGGSWASNVNPAIHTLAEAGVTVPPGYHMADVNVPPGEGFKDIADPLEGAHSRIAQSIAAESSRKQPVADDLLDFGDSSGAGDATMPTSALGHEDLLDLGLSGGSTSGATGGGTFNPRTMPNNQIYEGEDESAVFPAGPVQLKPPTWHEGYLLIGKSETETLLMRNKVRCAVERKSFFHCTL
jgi:hypothetical protein